MMKGVSGRMFHVTLESEVVWEHIHPDFDANPFFGEVNGIFRTDRHKPGEIPGL